MKIRYGFVSNSSSSSFVVGEKIKDKKAQLLLDLAGVKSELSENTARVLCETMGFSGPEYVRYVINNSSELFRTMKEYEYSGLSDADLRVIESMKENMRFYVVRISDEGDAIGCDLRQEVGFLKNSISNTKTKDVVVFSWCE